MSKLILTFGDIEVEKNKFCGLFRVLSPILLKGAYIQKVLVTNIISFGEKKNCKYFIGYPYNDSRFKPLHAMFPKTSAYVKSYGGETKWMYFFI